MNQRVSDYFAREAAEYLDQLDHLLGGDEEPNPAHLLRLSRGVRGSAQMAGAETIAEVAGRLEDAIRSVTSHNIVWTDEVGRLAKQTVDDLKILVRALHRWGPEEERRVRRAVERWDELDAPETAAPAAPVPEAVGVAGADADADVVPIESLFHDDAGPHVLSQAEEAVPIDTLLLTGDRALEEALALRPAVEALVRARGAADPRLAGLLDELFDLVRLGRSAPSAPR